MSSIEAVQASSRANAHQTNSPPAFTHAPQFSIGTEDGTDTVLVFMQSGPKGTSVPVLALPKTMDAEEMILLLYAVQHKQGQDQIKTSEQRIADSKEARQRKTDEILKKLKEAAEDEDKAEKDGKIIKIFGWIGVGLTWFMVGIATVISGGAAAAPLFIAAVALTAYMISQETGATDKAVEAMGLNDEQAMKFQIGLAVFMTALTIAMAVLSFGAAAGGVAASASTIGGAGAQAGSSAATTGSTAATTGSTAATTGSTAATTGSTVATTGSTAATNGSTVATTGSTVATTGSTVATKGSTVATTGSTVATKGSTVANSGSSLPQAASSGSQSTTNATHTAQTSGKVVRVANRVNSSAQVAQGGNQIGSGSAQIDVTVHNYDAANARADAQDEQAELAKHLQITYDWLQRIRKLIEQLQQAGMIVAETIADSRDTSMNIRKTI